MTAPHPFQQLLSRLGKGVSGRYSSDEPSFRPTAADAQAALALLPPAEQNLVARAVPTRQWDFARTRLLAHTVLAELGYPYAPLLWDEHHAPCWPEGVHGSLTHTRHFQAALLSASPDVYALGVDAEGARPLTAEVRRSIATPAELHNLAAQPSPLPLDTVLFSAKESLYKAWYPVTGAWLGFMDAELDLAIHQVSTEKYQGATTLRGAGTFTARVAAPVLATQREAHPLCQHFAECTGLWECGEGLIYTALVIHAPQVD